MGEATSPILTQFGVPPNRGSEALALEVNRSTGLLHAFGGAVPFVEEMIEMGVRWRNLDAAATMLTESTDPPDPDLVRADSAWLRFGQALVTDLTKAFTDPVDPDIVRTFESSAATTMTRQYGDDPDRDLLRVLIVHDQRLNVG